MKWITEIELRDGGCIAAINPRTGLPYLIEQPRINFNGLKWIQPRLSYHLNIEEIPRTPKVYGEGLVLHTCDHKWCICPEHLYLGTSSQNIKDIYDRMPQVQDKRIQSIKEVYASGAWGTKGNSKHRLI